MKKIIPSFNSQVNEGIFRLHQSGELLFFIDDQKRIIDNYAKIFKDKTSENEITNGVVKKIFSLTDDMDEQQIRKQIGRVVIPQVYTHSVFHNLITNYVKDNFTDEESKKINHLLPFYSENIAVFGNLAINQNPHYTIASILNPDSLESLKANEVLIKYLAINQGVKSDLDLYNLPVDDIRRAGISLYNQTMTLIDSFKKKKSRIDNIEILPIE